MATPIPATTADFRKGPRPRTAASFYLILSLAMAAVFVGGFSTTVPGDFTQTDPALPLLLHVHGAVFTLWVLVFVAQPAFVTRGSLRLHRQIGWLAAGLAVAMVVMALVATFVAIRLRFVPGFFPPRIFLAMNVMGAIRFGALVAAGVRMRTRAEWHKRLMLCATVSILGPGLGRLLPMASFGAAAPLVLFAVSACFALAGPLFDLATRRRIHPAYLWAVPAILITDLSIPLLAFAPPTGALLRAIQG